MPTTQPSRQASRISADQAAMLVKPGMWLDYGFGIGQPDLFDRALAARASELHDVNIRAALSLRPRAVLEADPDDQHFHWFNWHFSGYDRRHHDAGRCNYLPMNFGEVPDYYRRFIEPVDIVILKTCPMDETGTFNLSGSGTYMRAIVERARMVIVETSEDMPYVHGSDNGVHASEVDFVIDGGADPVPEIVNPPPAEIDAQIAARIVHEIEDGACLQVGIGGLPNAVCTLLKDSGARELGIHTEMMTDGLIALHEAGIATGSRKTIDKGVAVFTFAAGSRKQYDAINRNPAFACRAVDYTNLPHNIARNDKVFAINNTTQMDLQGQAASESDGHRHISGTGGQLQFARGAYASNGGKSFLCLASTYDKRGDRRSRIVSGLTSGNVVTTPRTDVMYVVTEYGMVNLKGKSVSQRARALISIAHPDFREQLEREAREKNIIGKGLYRAGKPDSAATPRGATAETTPT